MLKHFFIPSHGNKHTPHLLHRNALLVYVLVILSFNFMLSTFNVTKASFEVSSLLERHNEERLKSGLNPLKINTTLSRSATQKGQAMLDSDCWSHYCPDGKDWRDFFFAVDYDYIHAGENLAEGFNTLDGVMNAWMNSKTHRENILNPNFTEIGFGIIKGRYQGKDNNTIVVVHFGRPVVKANSALESTSLGNESIVIKSPENGFRTNVNELSVSGEVSKVDSTVGLKIDGDDAGRVSASGKNYDFKVNGSLNSGENEIQTQLLDINGNVLATSNTINIEYDTLPPYVLSDEVKVSESNGVIALQIKLNEPVKNLSTEFQSFGLTNISDTTYQLSVNRNQLDNLKTLVFESTDIAGNTAKFELEVSGVINKINDPNSQIVVIQNSISPIEKEFLEGLVANFNLDNPKNLFISVFLIYIIILLAIDFFVLYKTDMLDVGRSKSHLHLGGFIVLLLFMFVGGASGGILTGVSL